VSDRQVSYFMRVSLFPHLTLMERALLSLLRCPQVVGTSTTQLELSAPELQSRSSVLVWVVPSIRLGLIMDSGLFAFFVPPLTMVSTYGLRDSFSPRVFRYSFFGVLMTSRPS